MEPIQRLVIEPNPGQYQWLFKTKWAIWAEITFGLAHVKRSAFDPKKVFRPRTRSTPHNDHWKDSGASTYTILPMGRREQIPRFARDIEWLDFRRSGLSNSSYRRMECQLKIAVSHSEMENIIFVQDLEATSLVRVKKRKSRVLYVRLKWSDNPSTEGGRRSNGLDCVSDVWRIIIRESSVQEASNAA